MTVKAILSLKGGDVVTIGPTASLATAAKVLAERGIGAHRALARRAWLCCAL